MKIRNLLIGFLALIVLTSCGVDKESKNTKLTQNFDDNKVVVKLINKSEQNGSISYNISLKNENSSIIKQNNVFIIFPLKSQNGTKTNPLKIEAQGNKIDISSNQEVVLKAFVPKEVLEKNTYMDLDNPDIEIDGYYETVSNETHFVKINALK